MIRRTSLWLTSVAVIAVPTIALANEATTLQAIMQGLRDNLVEISDGLLSDDFAKVARGAAAIAAHPKIPAAQVQLVKQELGTEMAAFKQLDTVVHDLALEISAAAKTRDRETAISIYQRMIDGCFACHDAYKTRVADALSSP